MTRGERTHRLLCRLGLHLPIKAGNGGIYCLCCQRLVDVTVKPGLPSSGPDLNPASYWWIG